MLKMQNGTITEGICQHRELVQNAGHQLTGYEFEQAPGGGEGQESLGCCIPWRCKQSDMTEQLNNSSNDKSRATI